MRAELRNHLLAVARGDLSCKTGVTHVTGVTASSGYVPKPLQLRELRELRAKNDKSENELKNGVTQPITTTLEDAVSERVAIIEDDGSIPEVFRNAWARLNCDRPAGVSENCWWNAITAGGLLLDDWGERAAALGWQSADLFGLGIGLVWQLADRRGSTVISLDETGAKISAASGDHQRFKRRWLQ